jgi:transcription elongation GreA/GreB family factor
MSHIEGSTSHIEGSASQIQGSASHIEGQQENSEVGIRSEQSNDAVARQRRRIAQLEEKLEALESGRRTKEK